MYSEGGNKLKAFYIPSSVLALLLILSLLTSAYVQRCTDTWSTATNEIINQLEKKQWNDLESGIRIVHRDWQSKQIYFHLFLAHQNLDEAEKLFSGALAACREEDTVELRILLAQLISQFMYLADTQEISLKNIL